MPWYLLGGIAAANCIAAYQPKGAASLAASYINLNNPGTYNAAPGSAPTFDAATGWTFNGIGQYLVTGITPASGYSMIIRLSNVGTTGAIGEANANGRFAFTPKFTDNKVYYHSGQLLGVAPGVTAGVLGIAGQYGFRNGSPDSGAIGAWSAAGIEIYIGVANGSAAYLGVKVQAFVIYSVTITNAQMLAVSTAMAAL